MTYLVFLHFYFNMLLFSLVIFLNCSFPYWKMSNSANFSNMSALFIQLTLHIYSELDTTQTVISEVQGVIVIEWQHIDCIVFPLFVFLLFSCDQWPCKIRLLDILLIDSKAACWNVIVFNTSDTGCLPQSPHVILSAVVNTVDYYIEISSVWLCLSCICV